MRTREAVVNSLQAVENLAPTLDAVDVGNPSHEGCVGRLTPKLSCGRRLSRDDAAELRYHPERRRPLLPCSRRPPGATTR
jgi:hypothetical protein